MKKFFLILVILNLFPVVTLAQENQIYFFKSEENLEVKKLLLRFDSLIKAKKSLDSGPKLGKVEEDVGCSIRVLKKRGFYYSIYFDDIMKIDGNKIKIKKIDEIHPELIWRKDSSHTFYLANSYLVDIEVKSKSRKLDSGTEEEVIVRVSSNSGSTVVSGFRYCGC